MFTATEHKKTAMDLTVGYFVKNTAKPNSITLVTNSKISKRAFGRALMDSAFGFGLK
jgi:hypothetical protein